FIGYYGGKPIIEKYEKFHGVSWKEIKQFQKKFSKSKKEDFTLFFMRLLPIMPLSVISGVAGVIKYDVKRYSLATFFGVVPRNIFLALIGYNFGELYSLMAGRIDHAETIMTILIVLLIGFYIIGKKTGLFDGVRKKFLN
ncbi:MAG: VTT domain-containing protein, partial [Nanoarchaeota archaeon]